MTDPRHPYRRLREDGGSPEEIAALFAPDVVFNSPIFAKPVHGRDLVLQVMQASLGVRGGHYIAEFSSGPLTVLVWQGEIEGYKFQSFEMMATGEDGLIHQRTVAMRPFPVVAMFRHAMRQTLKGVLPLDYWHLEDWG